MKKGKWLLILCIILEILLINSTIPKKEPTIITVNRLDYKSNSFYEMQDARLFAIDLKVSGDFNPIIKSTPLTCRIAIEKMVRIIYYDETTELGEKYVIYNTEAGALMNPTKLGYDFVEWRNSDDAVVTDKTIINTPNDYKLYAQWDIRTSHVKVEPEGGNWGGSTEPQEFDLTFMDTKELEPPTRPGYRFNGWTIVTGEGSTISGNTLTMGGTDTLIKAKWTNTPPVITSIDTYYENTRSTENGSIYGSAQEIGYVTVKASDAEDGTPSISLACTSGSLCNHITIHEHTSSTGSKTFSVVATKAGIAALTATATDLTGLKATKRSMFYVYTNTGLVNAHYTNTTFDSGLLERIDAAYISKVTFRVKFAYGHSNGGRNDTMYVYGITVSGRYVDQIPGTVVTGNFSDQLQAYTIDLSNYPERFVQVGFHTYSPHNDCARSASIQYQLFYAFDESLM